MLFPGSSEFGMGQQPLQKFSLQGNKATGSKVLYEVKDQGENDQGRKTHFLDKHNKNSDGSMGGNLLNNISQQQNQNLFLTMRAYNVKKVRRSSNSNQSNASSIKCTEDGWQESNQQMEAANGHWEDRQSLEEGVGPKS
jgi:hypothetical protein